MGGKSKVILITGASSGLGLAVANHLEKAGHLVYAGARSYQDQPSETNSSCYRVNLDVTNQISIDKVVQQIIQKEGRIDVLINCAAVIVLGSIEDTTYDEYQKVLDTNLGGVIRMCKAVLPHMRNQQDGLIINFSSIMGVLAIPFQSAYSSSKFAIEGFTEALSMEVRDFGIKVTMLQPTDHKSGSQKYRQRAALATSEKSAYRELFSVVTKKVDYDEAHGSEPDALAKVVGKIVESGKPRLRYKVGKFDQKLSVFLKRILPGRLFESIIYSYYSNSSEKK